MLLLIVGADYSPAVQRTYDRLDLALGRMLNEQSVAGLEAAAALDPLTAERTRNLPHVF